MADNGEKRNGGCLKEVIYVIVILVVVSIAREMGAEFGNKLFSSQTNSQSSSAVSSRDILSTGERTKRYSAGGLSIELPTEFVQDKEGLNDYDGYCESDDSSVVWIKDDFDDYLDMGIDLEAYTVYDAISVVAGENYSSIYYDEGMPYYTYWANGFAYCLTVHKGSNAFWTVTQVCFEEDFTTFLPKFLDRAHTVVVE